ncbi:MAG: hypothetical protein QW666_01985 [Candidatus Woesearchaeota archaeon]
MSEFIDFLREEQVKELTADLEERLSRGAYLFIDNSAFAWPLKHMQSANNLKRINCEFIKKINVFYENLLRMLAKNGNNNLIIPKPIAEEVKKGAGGCLGEANKLLSNYDCLTESNKTRLTEAKDVLDALKKNMSSVYEYMTEICKREKTTPIADGLAELVSNFKGHFDSIKEASEQDIYLVACAFEHAILNKKDVNIVTEDAHIEHIAEWLYGCIVCEQTSITKKMLDRILPIKIYVISAQGDSRYCTKFNYLDVPIGKHYAFRQMLTLHYGMGTVLGSKAISNVLKDIPTKVRETINSLHRYLPSPAETTLPAPSIEKQARDAEKETPSAEKLVEKTKEDQAKEASIPEAKLHSTFAIVKEYAKKAFESKEETSEKELALSALEELLECSDVGLRNEINTELSSLEKKELSYKLNKINTELAAIDAELKKVISAEHWYDVPENFEKCEKLYEQLKRKSTDKREIESILSEMNS